MRARGGIGRRTGRAFTIIELLVVISIILILAGLVLAALGRVRDESRITNCKANLRNIGLALAVYAKNHGAGDVESYPPWLTYLGQVGGENNPYISNPKVFICPSDKSRGREGGRPDQLKQTDGKAITQFPMADVDRNSPSAGYLDGTGPTNSTNGGVDCSYLFEFCGEPCDWVYDGEDPPITPSTSFYVPSSFEWQWTNPPSAAKFKELADRDGNGVLSWNEVKVLSRKGCDLYEGGTHVAMKGWGVRVPIVRCYWHVEGDVLTAESRVLNLRGDASATEEGELMWFKD
jgi:prepilin-type N-terminal cleavage/methylation domain-containing protein